MLLSFYQATSPPGVSFKTTGELGAMKRAVSDDFSRGRSGELIQRWCLGPAMRIWHCVMMQLTLLSAGRYVGGLGCDGIRASGDIETDRHCRNGIQGEKRKYPRWLD